MRDFRDAKSMARTLRDALKVKSVDVSHSECLELIAKTFGLENWNVLAAKIEAAKLADAGKLSAATDAEATLNCSFCGKSQHQVSKLIAGPKVFICDACIGLCDDIMESETVLDLFAGRREAPAGYVEDLAANVERARKHSAHWRSTLEQIRRTIAAREAGETAPLMPFDSRAKVDLVALKDRYERALRRFDDAQGGAGAVG